MKELGFSEKTAALIKSEYNPNELARVLAEHKERYIVQSIDGVFQAEITGNMRFAAQTRADFPAVGDWVKIVKMDEQNAVILELIPRYSMLERQAVGKHGEAQLIAANIDYAFIVQAVGHDFNLNRLERYLSICYAGNIEPIIVLTKIDLIDEKQLQELKSQIEKRLPKVPLLLLSNITMEGFDGLKKHMAAFKTYCFIGSSGVGKSSVINRLLENELLETNHISESTQKGRHTTTHRELLVLPNQSIVIDTPGMRELGMANHTEGIDRTYNNIGQLAQNCRFADCSHLNEKGCAVTEAVENGSLPEDVYENYLKLKREQEHFSSTVFEKRRKGKEFSKMAKEVVKNRKKNKF